MEQSSAPESSKAYSQQKRTLPTVVSETGYIFPSIYSFPAFFTPAAQALPVFNNSSISRKLSLDMIRAIIDLMVESGAAEYDPPRPTSSPPYAVIYFHPLSYWSGLIYEYVYSHGLTNSVMTLHELSSEDAGGELDGLDGFVLRRALNALVKQGKAKMLKGTLDGVGGEADGVKFF